ncbi:MAG TPA: hypothetical protein VMY69_05985 [Phycisphaerae bacterium]|nr:hypothetical protein [Phycisphaerae bacterium]
MSLWTKITGLFKKADSAPAESTLRGTGYAKPIAMWPWDQIGQLNDIRTKIDEIDALDESNGQVKQLHSKLAKFATRGGVSFVLRNDENERMTQIANDWIKRVHLDKRDIRKEHARRLLKHGNIVLQNVVSSSDRIEALVVMPTQTMKPLVDDRGQFTNPAKAYVQMDPMGMTEVTSFAKWQISWGALDREANRLYGRPMIDAERKRAKQITMTDDDLVIRRRVRAALRYLHIVEGARPEEMDSYRADNKDSLENPFNPVNDFFSNKAGAITAIQGDANLDQIADVQLLNKKFYAGCGVTAHQFGLIEDDLNRDVYEDTLGDLFEVIEDIQETCCDTWEESLRVEFLLAGINADAYDWDLKLEGRKVETPNQRMDRGIKAQTMGIPLKYIVTEILNWPWEKIKTMIDEEAAEMDPYGARIDDELNDDQGKPPLKIVEGNQRGKQSATYVGKK